MRINNIKLFISCIILLLLCNFGNKNTYAQQTDTLIFREIGVEKIKRKTCSFRTIINVGFALPPKDNTYYRMQYGKSLQGMFGFQFKARLAKFYSIGADLMVSGNRYAIWQDEGKWFIDQKQNRKEFFRDGELSLAFTHQFKLNKGIKQTWAIDVSIYGAYAYSASHKTINIDHNPDEVYSGKTRTVVVERNLPYIERWLWGFRAGLTYRGVGIYVQYRMNNLVKLGLSSQYDAFDMPKLSLGLTFSGKVWGD